MSESGVVLKDRGTDSGVRTGETGSVGGKECSVYVKNSSSGLILPGMLGVFRFLEILNL